MTISSELSWCWVVTIEGVSQFSDGFCHGLWEWFMIFTLFARFTYVNILHWTIRLYNYGFLVNEGIFLILVIQTVYPTALSVLYSKDVYSTFSILWSTTFPFSVLKYILLLSIMHRYSMLTIQLRYMMIGNCSISYHW